LENQDNVTYSDLTVQVNLLYDATSQPLKDAALIIYKLPEAQTLAPKQKKSLQYQVAVPANSIAGIYHAVVEVKNRSGAIYDLSQTKLTLPGQGHTLVAVAGDSMIYVGTKPAAAKVNLPTNTAPTVEVTFLNVGNQSITAVPRIDVYSGDDTVHNHLITQLKLDAVTWAAGEKKTVQFTLPTLAYASYYAEAYTTVQDQATHNSTIQTFAWVMGDWVGRIPQVDTTVAKRVITSTLSMGGFNATLTPLGDAVLNLTATSGKTVIYSEKRSVSGLSTAIHTEKVVFSVPQIFYDLKMTHTITLKSDLYTADGALLLDSRSDSISISTPVFPIVCYGVIILLIIGIFLVIRWRKGSGPSVSSLLPVAHPPVATFLIGLFCATALWGMSFAKVQVATQYWDQNCGSGIILHSVVKDDGPGPFTIGSNYGIETNFLLYSPVGTPFIVSNWIGSSMKTTMTQTSGIPGTCMNPGALTETDTYKNLYDATATDVGQSTVFQDITANVTYTCPTGICTCSTIKTISIGQLACATPAYGGDGSSPNGCSDNGSSGSNGNGGNGNGSSGSNGTPSSTVVQGPVCTGE
jgi:hypothetical protein